MILSKRQEIERFLAAPGSDIRAALIYGRDRGVVRERGNALARKATANSDDPFDTALLTDSDIDGDPARLEGELAAIPNFGKKSIDEVIETLSQRGLTLRTD